MAEDLQKMSERLKDAEDSSKLKEENEALLGMGFEAAGVIFMYSTEEYAH